MSMFLLYQNMNLVLSIIIVVLIWDLIWKAVAMWRAAKRKEASWFFVLLIFNTAGVLPMLYLLFKDDPDVKEEKTSNTRTIKIVKAGKESTVVKDEIPEDKTKLKEVKKISGEKKIDAEPSLNGLENEKNLRPLTYADLETTESFSSGLGDLDQVKKAMKKAPKKKVAKIKVAKRGVAKRGVAKGKVVKKKKAVKKKALKKRKR